MSGPFKVGDVVCCVVAGPIACPCRPRTIHTGESSPPLRTISKIAAFATAIMEKGHVGQACGCTNVILSNGYTGNVHRFRHLPKADDQFIAEMRAIKPVREQVPA